MPVASLLDVNGTLYGTTEWGGSGGCRGPSGDSGCGTVFTIMTSGKETVLHNFGGGSRDGALPQAGLININGTLYGTTTGGGVNAAQVAVAERSSRSRGPVRKPCSTALRAARVTAKSRMRA